MAIIVPFPAGRRVETVRKLAAQMAGLQGDSAENMLQMRLKRHQNTLTGKGIDPAVIRQDLASFEGAVRAELWRLILKPAPHGGRSA
jgi:hypothetical protein